MRIVMEEVKTGSYCIIPSVIVSVSVCERTIGIYKNNNNDFLFCKNKHFCLLKCKDM